MLPSLKVPRTISLNTRVTSLSTQGLMTPPALSLKRLNSTSTRGGVASVVITSSRTSTASE